MPRAYSLDLRERVVAAGRDEHLTQPALAARFRVSETTVYNWLRRERKTGSVVPQPHGGGRRASVDAEGRALLTTLVGEQNDRTLEELGALYHDRRQVALSRSALSRTLIQLGLGRKKSR